MLAGAQQPLSIPAAWDPTQGMVCLHPSIDKYKTVPYRHAQRHISQVTLKSVKLTTLIIRIPI